MVATSVKDEIEWFQFWNSQHIREQPTYLDPCFVSFLFPLVQGGWSNVDGRYIESFTGKIDGIRARAATQINRSTGVNDSLFDNSLQFS